MMNMMSCHKLFLLALLAFLLAETAALKSGVRAGRSAEERELLFGKKKRKKRNNTTTSTTTTTTTTTTPPPPVPSDRKKKEKDTSIAGGDAKGDKGSKSAGSEMASKSGSSKMSKSGKSGKEGGADEIVEYFALLNAGQVVPPVCPSAAIGNALVTLQNLVFCVSLSYLGISSNEVSAFIAGPAPAGFNNDNLLQLPAGVPKQFCVNVTEEVMPELDAGNLYFTIQSVNCPNGELRGQIFPVSS